MDLFPDKLIRFNSRISLPWLWIKLVALMTISKPLVAWAIWATTSLIAWLSSTSTLTVCTAPSYFAVVSQCFAVYLNLLRINKHVLLHEEKPAQLQFQSRHCLQNYCYFSLELTYGILLLLCAIVRLWHTIKSDAILYRLKFVWAYGRWTKITSKSCFGTNLVLVIWNWVGLILLTLPSQQNDTSSPLSRSIVNLKFSIGFAQLAPVVKI